MNDITFIGHPDKENGSYVFRLILDNKVASIGVEESVLKDKSLYQLHEKIKMILDNLFHTLPGYENPGFDEYRKQIEKNAK
jgi:hypothetical protein